MDYAAALTDAEIQALSDPDQAYADTVGTSNAVAAQISNPTIFGESLRVWNTLNAYEDKAMTEPSWSVLAVLTNCEYRLHVLTQRTGTRHNPFLSHWVETIQRMDADHAQRGRRIVNASVAKNGITSDEIAIVRAEWIQRLLQQKDSSKSLSASPRQLYHEAVKQGQRHAFAIDPYRRMLVEEEIWDPPSKDMTSATPPLEAPVWPRKHDHPALIASKSWKEDMLQKLVDHPDAAAQELARLPLEISYLDFLTTLFADRTLQAHAMDPAPIITSYIQHALRMIEGMEAPPPTSGPDAHTVHGAGQEGIWEYGKEAQSRCVRLLLLFVKSLIRKGLLGAEVLYFEIQEVCVRYVWIKEVRDFRGWVEEGDEGE